MAKKCDNKSVGVIVKNTEDKILLIERKKYNPGFALPAGHCDGDREEIAVQKELFEEVGLVALYLRPCFLITLQNPCKRENGSYHRWTVFIAEKWRGEVKKSEEEVKSFIWADKKMITEFILRLEEFMKKNQLSIDNLPSVIKATNESELWKRNPGFEPPMYVIFKELRII